MGENPQGRICPLRNINGGVLKAGMHVTVLRLGHRKNRDKRVTTHVCLAARALGADGVVLNGEEDDVVLAGVRKVADTWGGKFAVSYEASWRKAIAKAKKNGASVVHLTMYGERVQDVIGAVRKKKRLLVVVGAGKVPGDVYRLADFNVAVTGQPHSEVAATAIFLHELLQGRELERKFTSAKLAIVPQKSGKKVVCRPLRARKN